MTVTRRDIIDSVGTAFIGGGADRRDLVALAKAGRARGEVVQVLLSLPERRYRRLHEVWDYLPELAPCETAGSSAAPLPWGVVLPHPRGPAARRRITRASGGVLNG